MFGEKGSVEQVKKLNKKLSETADSFQELSEEEADKDIEEQLEIKRQCTILPLFFNKL